MSRALPTRPAFDAIHATAPSAFDAIHATAPSAAASHPR